MIDLKDKGIWGKTAAEDEKAHVLDSYFIRSDAFERFLDNTSESSHLVVANARKGMGKSALLRQLATELNRESDKKKPPMVVSLKAGDLTRGFAYQPELPPKEQVAAWEQRLCRAINREIGKRLGFSWTEDQMQLVELAELDGFREQNLVGALLKRLGGKLDKLVFQKATPANDEQLLKRYLSENIEEIWFLIDDVDATYIHSPQNALEISTFLTACRAISTEYDGVFLRTCIRSDVWACIESIDESMDHLQDYLVKIQWSKRDFGRLLVERIKGYAQRNRIVLEEPEAKGRDDFPVLKQVMRAKFPQKKGSKPSYEVLYEYSGGRPRWLLQLCRMAAEDALKKKQEANGIALGHVNSVLKEFGRERLKDYKREHMHQCPGLAQVMISFKGQKRFEREDLLAFIDENVIQGREIELEGLVADPLELANFLYRIDFLEGSRGESENRTYVKHETDPDALEVPVSGEEWTWSVVRSLEKVLNFGGK